MGFNLRRLGQRLRWRPLLFPLRVETGTTNQHIGRIGKFSRRSIDSSVRYRNGQQIYGCINTSIVYIAFIPFNNTIADHLNCNIQGATKGPEKLIGDFLKENPKNLIGANNLMGEAKDKLRTGHYAFAFVYSEIKILQFNQFDGSVNHLLFTA